MHKQLLSPTERPRRNAAIDRAAEHIRRLCPPGDVGGRMVLAAFMQDSIDHDDTLLDENNK